MKRTWTILRDAWLVIRTTPAAPDSLEWLCVALFALCVAAYWGWLR
jgi:hypothetical protein